MYIKISWDVILILFVFKSYFSLYKFQGKVMFFLNSVQDSNSCISVIFLYIFLVIVTFRHVFNNKTTNYHDMREFLLCHLFYTITEPSSISIKRIFSLQTKGSSVLKNCLLFPPLYSQIAIKRLVSPYELVKMAILLILKCYTWCCSDISGAHVILASYLSGDQYLGGWALNELFLILNTYRW